MTRRKENGRVGRGRSEHTNKISFSHHHSASCVVCAIPLQPLREYEQYCEQCYRWLEHGKAIAAARHALGNS